MFDNKIPKLRKDIDLQIIGDGEDKNILLYDRRGFAREPLMITYDFMMFLTLLEEGITEKELQDILFEATGERDISPILESIKVLDDDLLLESENYFQKLKQDKLEYAKLPARPLITSGKSFPEESYEFAKFMDNLFNSKRVDNQRKNADAIIVPHIDLSLNGFSHPIYAAGYDAISERDFDTIVILGTSHFAFSDYFMLTKKPYITPNGIIENDDEVIDYLEKYYGDTFTFDDQAHRFEHSIEYQAVLSKYFFKNRNFKIIPILVGTFHQFISDGHQPNTDERINKFIVGLKEALLKSNRNPIFIASVDFSHIGMKFGDEFDAKDMLQECKEEDFKLIQSIQNTNKKAFFDNIIETQDSWKVCGVSPIYSLLSLIDSANGSFLDYNQWYEEPTKSSVSFASLAFWNK